MASNYRGKTDLLRCVNCGWVLKTQRMRVLELSPSERSLLANWLQPYDVPDLEARQMCMSCVDLLSAACADPSKPRRLGHPEICATCGESILIRGSNRRRSYPIDENNPEYEILKPYMQHYKEGVVKVCMACLQKGKRERDKNENKDKTNSQVVEDGEVKSHDPNELKTVTLEGYWKLQVEEGLQPCAQCGQPAAGRVQLRTRQQLLLRWRLYVPSHARVCARHAAPSGWADPAPAPPASCAFTAHQVADMLFLLKCMHPIDLGTFALEPAQNKISEEMALLEYNSRKWLGMTLEEFEAMLKGTPTLASRKDGRFALAVYLAYKNTGECYTVLASLCQRPRALIEASIKLARKHVKQSE